MSEPAGRSLLPAPLRLGRLAAALLLLAWSAFVAWGLLSDKVTEGASFWGSKFVFNLSHAGIFGLEALLLGLVLRPGRAPRPRGDGLWWSAAALAFAYSAWLEYQQGLVPGRSRSAVDLLTNALGIWGVPRALANPVPPLRWWLPWLAACAVSAGFATLTTW